MSPTSSSRACVVLALALTIAAAAQAQPVVFHSPADDGFDPGTPLVLSGLPQESLFLYVDAGPVASSSTTPCVDGLGDEICAYRFCVQTSGTVGLVDFVADAGADIVYRLTATELCATGGDAIDGQLGPVRLGELVVGSTDAGDAQVSEGEVVDSDLTLDPLALRVLAVPEPGFAAQLAAGAICLARLRRRRSVR